MLQQIYRSLYKFFGPQYWWPTAGSNKTLEIIIGAILTQQTSWSNAEKAIQNLNRESLINPEKLRDAQNEKLEKLIQPSGYYRQKTKKLKNFINFLWEKHNGKLERLFDQPIHELREDLLSVNGIGKETADSIILYAAEKPIFVIDAYTARSMNRIGITQEKEYGKLQEIFHNNLPHNAELFNEFHALIVRLGKDYCRKKPKCKQCPMNARCNYANSINNLPDK